MNQNKKESYGVWLLINIIVWTLLMVLAKDFIVFNAESAAYERVYFQRKHDAAIRKHEQSPVALESRAGIANTVATYVPGTEGEESTSPSNSISQIEEMIVKELGEVMLKVAKAESGLDPRKESNTDLMADGRPFSIGLLQLNITWHKVNGLDCPSAFKGKNYDAVVVNEDLYNKCVEAAKDPVENVRVAKNIPIWQWGAYTNGAYLNN